MSETFALTCGNDTVVLPRPEYGYEVEIHFPVSQVKAADGTRSFYCNAPPYRIVSSSSFTMKPADKRRLDDFLRITARGAEMELALGTEPSGFFPFGPDIGDMGTFGCCLTEQTPTGQLFAPFGWFGDDYHLVMTHVPADVVPYTFGEPRRQGDFAMTIGNIDITDLPYPDNGFIVNNAYSYTTILGKSGIPSSIDERNSADNYVSSCELSLYQVNAAKLVNALATAFTANAEHCTIYDNGYYVFGVNNDRYGTYHAWFLGSGDSGAGSEIVLKITHEHFNRFKIPLTFLLETTITYSYAAPLYSRGAGVDSFMLPLYVVNAQEDREFGAIPISVDAISKVVSLRYNTSQFETDSTTRKYKVNDEFIKSQYGRLPICTTAQRNALTVGVGMLVYDTDASGVYVYTGVTWKQIG